ncbi:MAG: hypothetical protein AMXMBFR23_17010 [Chloroflexota bacterium]
MPEQGAAHAWQIGRGRHAERDADARVLVSTYMSSPVITIAADTPVAGAMAAMSEYRVHHLLLHDRDRIVAIVSDRDLHRHAGSRAGTQRATRADDAALRHPVYRLATYGLITVSAHATIEEAAALVLERGVSALPVTDGDDGIVGMITTRDLLRGLLTCALPGSAVA